MDVHVQMKKYKSFTKTVLQHAQQMKIGIHKLHVLSNAKQHFLFIAPLIFWKKSSYGNIEARSG